MNYIIINSLNFKMIDFCENFVNQTNVKKF